MNLGNKNYRVQMNSVVLCCQRDKRFVFIFFCYLHLWGVENYEIRNARSKRKREFLSC